MMKNGEASNYVKVVGTKIGVLGDALIIEQENFPDFDSAGRFMQEKTKNNDMIWTVIPKSIVLHN